MIHSGSTFIGKGHDSRCPLNRTPRRGQEPLAVGNICNYDSISGYSRPHFLCVPTTMEEMRDTCRG